MEIEENKDIIKILCHNARGFPCDRYNRHKLDKIDKWTDGKDAVIVLETGTNEKNELLITNRALNISKENKMD